jgi:hypothetical protein
MHLKFEIEIKKWKNYVVVFLKIIWKFGTFNVFSFIWWISLYYFKPFMLNVYVPMVRSHETVRTFTKPSSTLWWLFSTRPKDFRQFNPFLAGLVINIKWIPCKYGSIPQEKEEVNWWKFFNVLVATLTTRKKCFGQYNF